MWACRSGQKDVVQLLLDQPDKIRINAQDKYGLTGLMYACKYGHRDIVELFLKYKEKGSYLYTYTVFVSNNNGQDALMLAEIAGHKDIAKLLRDF